jgi:hypothetical protein
VRSAWLVGFALVGSSACYRYVPVEPSSLASGTEVTVDLSSAGSATVRPSVGDFATRLEGRVSESSTSGITLLLSTVQRRGEVQPSTWNGESIRLSTADIAGMRTRELSRGRTTVAAVALGAATVGLVVAIARAVGLLEVSGGGGKPIPPP